MSHPVVPHDAQPCVWMSAGLLTYRLCDREFDCENCSLDAALRGEPLVRADRVALSEPGARVRVFPDDRRYSTGHTWVQTLGENRSGILRLGLDAFAAAIIGRASEVDWDVSGRMLERSERACQIDLDLGMLPLGAPVAGRVVRGNPALQDDPGQVVTAPYEDGWILELASRDRTDAQELLSADVARDRMRLDLQRFRRRVALYLLSDASAVGPSLSDGGELLVGLREMLGGSRYLELLRELIH